MFNVGDEVRVVVLKFDPAQERVSLGLKQIQEDPWHRADEKYPVGTRVKGKVVSLTDYGAFIEIEQGVEGLVHVSEMSWTKRVKHPSKMLEVGQEVEAVVLDIDPKAKRIALGMKQIEQNPWTLLEDKYPIGSVIKGQVRNVTDFGIFVGVEEGVDRAADRAEGGRFGARSRRGCRPPRSPERSATPRPGPARGRRTQ